MIADEEEVDDVHLMYIKAKESQFDGCPLKLDTSAYEHFPNQIEFVHDPQIFHQNASTKKYKSNNLSTNQIENKTTTQRTTMKTTIPSKAPLKAKTKQVEAKDFGFVEK